MAKYIKKQELLNDTRVYKDDNEVVRVRKLHFRNYIKSLPTADVVERAKIDKAIEEIEKQKKLIIEYEGESDLGIAIKIIKECLGEVEE